MIDVFIRTAKAGEFAPLRLEMCLLVEERWDLEDANIHWLPSMGIREGRMQAEREAQSDPYIYTDDDVLIVGEKWVERGTRVMLDNPHFAVVSTLSLVEGENLAQPTNGDL